MAAQLSYDNTSEKITTMRQSGSVLAQRVNDVSYLYVQGANSVSVPRMAPSTSSAIALTACFVNSPASLDRDTIMIDKVLGGSFALKTELEKQNIVSVKEKKIDSLIKAMGFQLDSLIYAAMTAATQSAEVERTASIIADLISLKLALDAKNVSPLDRSFAPNATDMVRIMSEPAFIQQFSIGSAEGLIEGRIGRLFGMDILDSQAITGDSVAFQKEAVAYVTGELNIGENYDAKCRETTYAVSQEAGVVAVDNGNFIAKLVAP